MKIRSVSLIFTFAVSCLSILAISIFSQFSYSRLLNQASEDGLAEFASFIAADISQADNLESAIQLLAIRQSDYAELEVERSIYNVTKNNPENRIYVTDSEGRLIFNNGSPESLGESRSRWIDVAAALSGRYGARTTMENGAFTLYSSVPVVRNGKVMAVVSVAHSNRDMLAYLITAGNRLFMAATMVLAISLLLALLFAVLISSPLTRLNSYVLKLTSRQEAQIPKTSISEIKLLTDSFRHLHDELSGKKYVEKALQAISHEIRSPVTAIKAASELLSDNQNENRILIKSINEQSHRIGKLIDDLLDLSRIKNIKDYERAELMDFSLFWKELQQECSSLGGQLQFENHVSTHCKIDGFMLRRAVLILIENSLKFSSKNQLIKICADNSESEIRITVKDTGSGIPEWAELKIFDEFFSLPAPEKNQKGSGIGLSLAKHIALYHSGNLEVFNSSKISPDDKGVTARLTVPLVV